MPSDDDALLLARFERAELGHQEFRHRDHLRVAWLYLRELPLEEAMDAMRRGLRRLTAAHGQPGRYDEALTRAWVELVAEARARDGAGAEFDALLAANPELLDRETGARRAKVRAAVAAVDLDARIAAAAGLLAERRGARRGKPERSFLSIHELAPEEVLHLLRGGLEVKANPEGCRRALAGRAVALLFQKTSTRTRCSFEVGVGEMGGQPVYIDWRTSNFTLGELQDEIKVLSRYFDLIMARVYRHEDLLTMREHSEVPIVNGLDDRYHPCQGLTDYMTVLEYFGALDGLKLAYVGDGNNVCHSLIDGGAATGVHVAVAHPAGYAPREDVVERARARGARVTITHEQREAVAGADVVYTDTWVSMGDEAQTQARLAAFAGYQVNEELLAAAPAHALVMHCLPAHRGLEISGAALDSPNSVVFDQAENRKHLQKYLLAWILEAV